jgi:hypothetical protein
MRLPGVRFTVRRMMVWVAVAGFASMVGVQLWRVCIVSDQPDAILLTCGVATALGIYSQPSEHAWYELLSCSLPRS